MGMTAYAFILQKQAHLVNPWQRIPDYFWRLEKWSHEAPQVQRGVEGGSEAVCPSNMHSWWGLQVKVSVSFETKSLLSLMEWSWSTLSKLFICLLATFDSGKVGCDNHEPLVSNRQIVQFTFDADSVPQSVQNRSAACQPAMSRHSWCRQQ